jgi:transcriptional regulator with GAF, ATPase, and Fis domain
MSKNNVPVNKTDLPANVLGLHDISSQALLTEVALISDPRQDLRSILSSLAQSVGAKGFRVLQHEEGELRDIGGLLGTTSSLANVNLGMRERLLRTYPGSRVRIASSKVRRFWQALVPELGDAGSALMFELVLNQRLLGIGFLLVDDWQHDPSGRLAAWLEPLTLRLHLLAQERELVRLRATIDAGTRQRLDSLTYDPQRHEIIGASGGLRQVMERVELVSGSDVPVLLFGETGSGKEVIARAIHERSARHREPFVRINCGAIPPELIDSQLFGHERGSFTGATEQRKGWFERASGGTLFLDEVGELPLAAQVRLLRVLQDHTFERVGGQAPVRVDCRIVAATHRDLPKMVQAGQFREDLWYRLAVFPLVIPPLRERPIDIPPLARFFARRAIRFGLAPCMPSESDLALLLAYDWPGNVRELAAVLDRAAILGRGLRLDVETSLGAPRIQPEVDASPEPAAPPRATPALSTLAEAMRVHIETVLTVCEGRIEGPRGAAKILGINPHTLRSRMRKLQIEWQHYRQGAG